MFQNQACEFRSAGAGDFFSALLEHEHPKASGESSGFPYLAALSTTVTSVCI